MTVYVNAPSTSKAFKNLDEVIYIVVDTFRATTSLVTLKKAGVKRIYVVQNEIEARKLQQEMLPNGILIGEKGGLKIEGFDYGNTPSLFHNLDFNNKEIIFTSTSGAKAITALNPSKQIFIGSLVNLTSISDIATEIAMSKQKDVCVVPAGYSLNEEEYVLEDWVTGLLIAEKISINLQTTIESENKFLKKTQKILEENKNLKDLLSKAPNALYLDGLGFKEDVDFAISIDKINNFLKVKKWLHVNEIDCVALE